MKRDREQPDSAGNDDREASYEAPAVANNFPGENQFRLVRGRAAWRHWSCSRAVAVIPARGGTTVDGGSEAGGEGERRQDDVGLEVKKEWNGNASVNEPLLPRWSSSALLGGVRGGDDARGNEKRQRDEDHRFSSLPFEDRGTGIGTGELGGGSGPEMPLTTCGCWEGSGGCADKAPFWTYASCRHVFMTTAGT
jgi:hypothetical protein